MRERERERERERTWDMMCERELKEKKNQSMFSTYYISARLVPNIALSYSSMLNFFSIYNIWCRRFFGNTKPKKKSLIAGVNSRNNIYIYIYSYYRFPFYFIFQFKTLTKSSHSRSRHLLYFSYFISNSKLNLNIKIKSLATNDTLTWEKIQSLIKNFGNKNINLNSNLRA